MRVESSKLPPPVLRRISSEHGSRLFPKGRSEPPLRSPEQTAKPPQSPGRRPTASSALSPGRFRSPKQRHRYVVRLPGVQHLPEQPPCIRRPPASRLSGRRGPQDTGGRRSRRRLGSWRRNCSRREGSRRRRTDQRRRRSFGRAIAGQCRQRHRKDKQGKNDEPGAHSTPPLVAAHTAVSRIYAPQAPFRSMILSSVANANSGCESPPDLRRPGAKV